VPPTGRYLLASTVEKLTRRSYFVTREKDDENCTRRRATETRTDQQRCSSVIGFDDWNVLNLVQRLQLQQIESVPRTHTYTLKQGAEK